MELGYARVSTDDQRLDLQLDALNKAGCAEIFTDKLSGARDDRPELERCLNRLRKGDTLIVWKLDRLGRSLHHLMTIMEDLEQRGINFKSLNESIDTTNHTGRFMFVIMGGLAEFERNLIRERTIAGKQASKSRGKFQGGKRMYGEEPHGEKQKAAITAQQVAAERDLLKDLARSVLDGTSLSAITRDLRNRKITTANGGQWSPSALRRALTNQRTAAAILGDDQYRDLLRAFSDPETRKKRGRASKYMLTGIIRCQCGTRMYVNLQGTGQGNPRYRCLHSYNVKSCRKVSVLAAPLEAYVTKETIRWLAGPGLRVVRNRLLSLDRGFREAAERMHADELELVELAKLKGQGRFTVEEWLALRDPIEARIRQARDLLSKEPTIFVLANIPDTRKELEVAWETWDIDKRRQVLKASIASLVIHQTQQRGPVFDEDRVQLTFVSDVPPFDRPYATEQANGRLLDQVARGMESEA